MDFLFRFQVGGTFHQVLYITVVHTNDHIKMIKILRTDRTGTMGQIVTAAGSMHPHTAVGQFPSMMADSVEAASRSLPEYTEESISTLVDKIIDTQVSEGYFKECPITFKDIATVKALFKEKLKTMYHTRISYPELKK